MKTKVTLSLEKDFVERAKRFARSNQKTLSQQITDAMQEKMQHKKVVGKKLEAIKNLSGSIKLPETDANKPFKQLRDEAHEHKFKKKFDL